MLHATSYSISILAFFVLFGSTSQSPRNPDATKVAIKNIASWKQDIELARKSPCRLYIPIDLTSYEAFHKWMKDKKFDRNKPTADFVDFIKKTVEKQGTLYTPDYDRFSLLANITFSIAETKKGPTLFRLRLFGDPLKETKLELSYKGHKSRRKPTGGKYGMIIKLDNSSRAELFMIISRFIEKDDPELSQHYKEHAQKLMRDAAKN